VSLSKAALPVAVVPVLVPSPTPASPPDQSDGELVTDETGALTVDADVDAELVVVSEATDSGADDADEAADDSVEGVSGTSGSADGEDGDSEPGDFEEGEEGDDGALDDGGHGLVDVPGLSGLPGLAEAEEAHGDGESEDGDVGGDTVTEGLAGFTGGGVLWSCRPVSPWCRPNQSPRWGS
jgi:hypothetical protein